MDHQCAAMRPGQSSPEKDEALTVATAQGSWDQGSSNSLDSELRVDLKTQRLKAFATLQARAALAGFELVRMADDSFVVARWTMTRALADVAAVESFLAQVGAK